MTPYGEIFWNLLRDIAILTKDTPITRHYLWIVHAPPYHVLVNPHRDWRAFDGRSYAPKTAYVFKEGKLVCAVRSTSRYLADVDELPAILAALAKYRDELTEVMAPV